MPDFRHGIPALEKLKLNSIIRRLQAPDDAPAPDTAAEETPLTLLPGSAPGVSRSPPSAA